MKINEKCYDCKKELKDSDSPVKVWRIHIDPVNPVTTQEIPVYKCQLCYTGGKTSINNTKNMAGMRKNQLDRNKNNSPRKKYGKARV